MPGPSKKPAQLKAIAGTIQPCRAAKEVPGAAQLPTITDAPEPPDWLPNAHAVKEWHRLARILTANKLLTEGGISALGMLCALHGQLTQIYAAGMTPTASMIGKLQAMHNDFGLTPVSQGKVTPVGDEKKGNKFANNGNRERTA